MKCGKPLPPPHRASSSCSPPACRHVCIRCGMHGRQVGRAGHGLILKLEFVRTLELSRSMCLQLRYTKGANMSVTNAIRGRYTLDGNNAGLETFTHTKKLGTTRKIVGKEGKHGQNLQGWREPKLEAEIARQSYGSATARRKWAGVPASWRSPGRPRRGLHRRLRTAGLSSGSSTGFHAGPSAVAFSGLARALSSSACGQPHRKGRRR